MSLCVAMQLLCTVLCLVTYSQTQQQTKQMLSDYSVQLTEAISSEFRRNNSYLSATVLDSKYRNLFQYSGMDWVNYVSQLQDMYNLCNSQSRFDYYFFTANFSTGQFLETVAVVSTRQGKVRGYCYDDLVIFKGIPYAQAKRFHAPQPVAPWEGIFDAGSYGMICPLLEKDKPNGEVLIPHRYWPTDENCQNLNIWTPSVDDGKRPVLVWLHGGGFSAGSSIEQVAYDGANMARLGNVVVVSVNHRLNILGYFGLSEYGEEYANSGNAGGDDIIASLSWVHDNIAAFGGDPECVTVFGQSGGGAKVTTLLQSPAPTACTPAAW